MSNAQQSKSPETDAVEYNAGHGDSHLVELVVPSDFARTLEQQRDEVMVRNKNLEALIKEYTENHSVKSLFKEAQSQIEQLTQERDSLREELKKLEKSHKDLFDEAKGYLMTIGNKISENQLLTAQHNLDVLSMQRLMESRDELTERMAVMVEVLIKVDNYLNCRYEPEVIRDANCKIAVREAIANAPAAAKELMNELKELRQFKASCDPQF